MASSSTQSAAFRSRTKRRAATLPPSNSVRWNLNLGSPCRPDRPKQHSSRFQTGFLRLISSPLVSAIALLLPGRGAQVFLSKRDVSRFCAHHLVGISKPKPLTHMGYPAGSSTVVSNVIVLCVGSAPSLG